MDEINKRTILYIIPISLSFFVLDILVYQYILIPIKIKMFWATTPLILLIIITVLNKIILRIDKLYMLSYFASLVSIIFFVFYKSNDVILNFVNSKLETIITITIISIVASLIVCYSKSGADSSDESETNKDIFNLLYINTSKVHEIAMLIDNKIMKTVEKEQISEMLSKNNSAIRIKSIGNTEFESNLGMEESNKNRVYESFDVKTTKSIMLRKIYDYIKNKKKVNNFSIGEVVLFNNRILESVNIDNTAMMLNMIQDSKLKNPTEDNIEFNLSKIFERMLNDFTVDYKFKGNDNENEKIIDYLIQLPYQNNENFENGYQHNDLQLGQLSIIGIYRGVVDFSKKESISSKFLEAISESQKSNKKIELMKQSSLPDENTSPDLEFSYRKFKDKVHLIDVIAIIQELSLEEES